jgi:hypothetical protein
MVLLYRRAGALTAKNGGFRPGQSLESVLADAIPRPQSLPRARHTPTKVAPLYDRVDLSSKSLSELELMASEAKINARDLEDAMDSRNPKPELIQLLMQKSELHQMHRASQLEQRGRDGGGGDDGGGAASKKALQAKKLSELSAMARDAKLDAREIEGAMDKPDPKVPHDAHHSYSVYYIDEVLTDG